MRALNIVQTTVLILVTTLLLTVAAFAQGPPGQGATAVETIVVQPERFQTRARAVGTLLADASAMLRAEVPGPIVSLHFEDGQPVEKGDRLFSIEATVLQAEANEARAKSEQSAAAYRRAQELIEKQLISATDYDTARANADVDVARLKSSESRLEKTVIRAPFDGFAGLRQINIGDYATVGQELVSVVRLDPLLAEFNMPETMIASIKTGQPVSLTVASYPQDTFAAEITAIAPEIDVAGHSLTVRARVPNDDLKLRPGLFVQVNVTLAENANALVVPEQAIWPIGEQKTVFVVVDGKAKQRTVKLGQRETGRVEVLEGLSAGDELVIAGQMKIFDGAAVRAVSASG